MTFSEALQRKVREWIPWREIPSVRLKSKEGEVAYEGKENLSADHMSTITVIDLPDKDTSIFRHNTNRQNVV